MDFKKKKRQKKPQEKRHKLTREEQEAQERGAEAGKRYVNSLKEWLLTTSEFTNTSVDWQSAVHFAQAKLPESTQAFFRMAFLRAADERAREILGEPAPFFRWPPRSAKAQGEAYQAARKRGYL